MPGLTKAAAAALVLALATPRADAASVRDCAAPAAPAEETACLIERAAAGDRAAVIALADRAAAGGPGAPQVADVVAAETALAERGDPVMTWRLARRYETGDGVPQSTEEMIRWTRRTATADPTHPNARAAAYRLCAAYGRGEDVARDEAEARLWCQRAADAGHPGAAIALAQLNSGR